MAENLSVARAMNPEQQMLVQLGIQCVECES